MIQDTYLIKEVLGKGGMGAVYRAEHVVMKNDYAVKILLADTISEDSWQRFQLEARAIAKMDHPNIVKVHNMGIDKGRPYYVMDLLQGKTLQALSRSKGGLPPQEALPIFSQIARGLAYAHDKGIIHRDIKPSNIMLLPAKNNTYTVKVVDFGMAKLGHKRTTIDSQFQTKAGEVLGSPLYMSPEQCTGERCDQRSDIYSLGCALFEVLTGTLPFKGNSAMETMMMHQSAPVPSIRERKPDGKFGMPLEAMVTKMLDKNPDRRYQSMEDVAHDLERIAVGKGIGKDGFNTVQLPGTDIGTITQSLNEQEFSTAHKNSDKKLILMCSAAALTLTVLAGVAYIMLAAPKPAPSERHAHKHSELVPEIGDKEPPPLQQNDPEALQRLQEAGPIVSRIQDTGHGRLRCIKFPDTSIGFYSYVKDQGLTDMHHAKGLRSIPAESPLTLNICPGDEIVAFYHPQIYQRIAPHEIAQLGLSTISESTPGEVSDEMQTERNQHALEILEIASHWKALKALVISKLALNDAKARSILDKFSTVEKLDLEDMPGMDGEKIASTRLCQNLKDLRLHNCGKVFPFLAQVLLKNHLQTLALDGTDVEPGTVKLLSRAHTLNHLRLLEGHLDEPTLKTLGELTNLKDIEIKDEQLTDEQIRELLKQSHSRRLILSKRDYKNSATVDLFKNVGQVTFIEEGTAFF